MTNSQRERMDRTASRYSSLFTLPSYRNIAVFLCTQCIITGIATVLPFNPSLYGLPVGLALGLSLFLATLLGNYLTVHALLKNDLMLNLRRCSFLSLASNLLLSAFAFVAALASALFGSPDIWFKIASLGAFTSISLRFLVFYSISFAGGWKIFTSVILQPALFLGLFLAIPFSPHGFQSWLLLCFPLATAVAFLGVYLFVTSVNAVGTEMLGIPSIKMLKAFLANWTEDLEEPLEEALEQLSEEHEVKVSMLAFKTEKKMKAVIVFPSIHPGPFKNVGSSPIPSLIQKALEKKLGCVVSVPHGISGHELDLASQEQNEKILNRIREASEFDDFQGDVAPFISSRRGNATAGCQIFGDCALLTLTLAPKTMEDLPLELNDFIAHEAKEHSLACAVAIDAHNSLQGAFNPQEAIAPIKKAVTSVLEKAARYKQSRFEVGAATVTPTDFSTREGIGPGGISVVAIRVGNQKTVYVTIDGNNMVSGLREKILSGLRELSIKGGEILTTDTHVVNAVIMADRGYHPVGDGMDYSKLIDYIRTAAKEALGNLEPVEVAWHQETIQGVKVIGEQQIDNLCMMIDEAAEKARKTSALVFPALGILLTVALVFL